MAGCFRNICQEKRVWEVSDILFGIPLYITVLKHSQFLKSSFERVLFYSNSTKDYDML